MHFYHLEVYRVYRGNKKYMKYPSSNLKFQLHILPTSNLPKISAGLAFFNLLNESIERAMHFSAFEANLFLSWACFTVAQQAEYSHDISTSDSDLALSPAHAQLPVIDSDNSDNSDNSVGFSNPDTHETNGYTDTSLALTDLADPNGLVGPYDMESTDANEPKILPDPMLIADDEAPPDFLNNPPCSFGNPMVPARGRPSRQPMDPEKPPLDSKQLFCCVHNFRSCVKYFTPVLEPHTDTWARDHRCDYVNNLFCCTGIKQNTAVDDKGKEGEGEGCEPAKIRESSTDSPSPSSPFDQFLRSIERIPGEMQFVPRL